MKSFKGLKIGAFETRRQEEIARQIRDLGGVALVAPSMKEIPLTENREVLEFGDQLVAGKIDLLILQTGVGTDYLLKTLQSRFTKEDLKKHLKAITILTRGPKPAEVLKEFGVSANLNVPEPSTWREVLKLLDAKKDIKGLSVVVQEAREPNRLLLGELKVRGARVVSLPVYRTVLPDDLTALKDVIEKCIQGQIDILVFTNSLQVDHVMAVARQNGRAQEFRRAAAKAIVSSVGPYCASALQNHGLTVDFEPARSSMTPFLEELSQKWPELKKKKKSDDDSLRLIQKEPLQPKDPLYQSLFLKACRKEVTSRTPIWLMRQAGRYMKEYRELRAKVPFLELCKNSDLASEVTVDAAHRLEVDAAIIFSDLLLLAEPLGFDLSYGSDQGTGGAGPHIANPFRKAEDLERIQPVEVEDSMRYVMEAIRKTRAALRPDIPLIGFAGAPFTMAAYLIEGKTSRNFTLTKKLMFEAPDLWHAFLEKITVASIEYLNAQIKAGVQAVQIFDSWVGCLSPEDFRSYVLPHTKRLVKSVTPGVPVITFGTQTTGFLPLFREAGGDVVGVDWRVELDEAWDQLGDVAIQGNMDPVVLLSTPKEIKSQAKRILNQAAGRPGHIFNLGHGVLPETPIENVLTLVEAVREYSKR